MDSAGIHTLILYGGIAAILLYRLFARQEPKPGAGFGSNSVGLLWPFVILIALESLSLRASGHILAECLVPFLTALAVGLGGSPDVTRRCRLALALFATAIYVHSSYLLVSGEYCTKPYGLAPGKTTLAAWYTPLTGIQRIVKKARW